MSIDARSEIVEFFTTFERASNDLDAAWLGSAFAAEFLNLSPDVAGPVTKEMLIAALPMRDKLFGSIGGRGSRLSGLVETPLDGLHTLVKTQWSWTSSRT